MSSLDTNVFQMTAVPLLSPSHASLHRPWHVVSSQHRLMKCCLCVDANRQQAQTHTRRNQKPMREIASFPRFCCFQARSCSEDQNGLKLTTRQDLGPQGAQDLNFSLCTMNSTHSKELGLWKSCSCEARLLSSNEKAEFWAERGQSGHLMSEAVENKPRMVTWDLVLELWYVTVVLERSPLASQLSADF